MAQVLKPEVRARILDAAGSAFAERGYRRTSMAQIARAAGTATANLYRYFPDKAALFGAVVPAATANAHDALLEARLATLGQPAQDDAGLDLLEFWVAHRWAVIILLDRAEDTDFSDYPGRFVQRLIARGERTIGRPATAAQVRIMGIVFDNTRRAIAEILRSTADPEQLRALVQGFWSYQLPGLEGLAGWMRGATD